MTRSMAKRPPEALFTLDTDQWTAPFWTAAAERRLTAPRCAACGTFRMPPTPFCPACRSQSLDWPTLSGKGVLYSYTVVTRAIVPEMEEAIPYVPALVTLPDAGGVRLITNVVETCIDDLRIDAELRVTFHERQDGTVLPFFVQTGSVKRPAGLWHAPAQRSQMS